MDSLVALGAAAGLVYSLIEMGLLAAGKVTGMPVSYTHLLGQPGIHGGAGHQRERQVDAGDEERAGQVQGEESPVGFEVGEEYPQGAAGLIIFRGHAMPRLVFF